MAGNPLTLEVARKVLKKLDAQDVSEKGDPHPTFAVFHNGKIVATTGLRRSSKRDIPVPHIKNDLRANARFLLEMASCTKYLADWLLLVGLVVEEEEGKENKQ